MLMGPQFLGTFTAIVYHFLINYEYFYNSGSMN